MYLLNFSINNLVPKSIKTKTDINTLCIDKFIQSSSRKIKNNSRVLDAGAGSCPYKKYFTHTRYESTDFDHIFDRSSKNIHNFICNLVNIPRPNSYYDVIICTEVLEHLEYPLKVVQEFNRILKKNGKLFLTAPQSWGLHGEPYHFYNFTKYGLRSIFNDSGFKIISIKPRGGIFWYLGFLIKNIPDYLYSQYLNGSKLKKYSTFVIYLISLPGFIYLIPYFLYFLDRFDKKKTFTLGYSCYCVK